MIIEAIGEDPEREGLVETPDRIARMYGEIFSGLKEDSREMVMEALQLFMLYISLMVQFTVSLPWEIKE